ncbi:2-oxoglutarate dehydrogenase E1 component [Bacillus mesophilum]|uniref:oxoglutarate dehydrogenase (succinyl-transferring) n=1 Tax=Bacillus mesophilum TaxID=1071718 RepID=A0A7V7UXI1_9BACI|nr:2-oxoglutarate dehydrogenase E1 component [Bacillus mesophilum]KAB2335785.1 2-oxoglutarate dehydrogenase E1 component [Bacillus mesophilum]
MNNFQSPWSEFSGPNLGYLLEQYDLYLQSPEIVDESLAELFAKWGQPKASSRQEVKGSEASIIQNLKNLSLVLKLAADIRERGHLLADIYPLEDRENKDLFLLERYGLTEETVREVPSELICSEWKDEVADGFEAIQKLLTIYTGKIGYEVLHVEPGEREWLLEQIEIEKAEVLTVDRKKQLLRKLYETEGFEQYLHRTYVGAKRFSVEGLEMLIPSIEELVSLSAQEQVEDIAISMAHRGRLNVLAHVIKKPYEAIFSQFQHVKWLNESEDYLETSGSTGDVKYHMGGKKKRIVDDRQINVTLAYNPSHLEYAGAVVEGVVRALQENRDQKGYPVQDTSKAIPLLIHGDAAFAGQGVVAEMFNFAGTNAYQTGGTMHIIANNRIGFTTEGRDSRSTLYSSDLAKGYGVPVFHVNADDPEACIRVMKLAFAYRQAFRKDVVIDLIGYRRLGHNEMDEPMATNPLIYQLVRSHPTITELYKKQLLAEKSFTEDEINAVQSEVMAEIKGAAERMSPDHDEPLYISELQEKVVYNEKALLEIDTTVEAETLVSINKSLLKWPENFNTFGKLEKILMRRLDVFEKKAKIDWSHAEALAYGTIIKDGIPIRLTGQDSERGTFSHRNIVLSDELAGNKYCTLHQIDSANASFAVHNSTLTETATLGFEYGYNLGAPETLVMWEAQFGDFANCAQVIADQFISSAKAKWGQNSGLVLLLPHGYEGQGPEHSSARLERYLQLSAENNWSVANLSSSAQYFHLLRRQAATLNTDLVKPLVLMTPKSLLRHQSAAAELNEFTSGEFHPIIEEPNLGANLEKVEKIVICSGRLAVELSDQVSKKDQYEWLQIIRIEELYPFPEKQILECLSKYKNVKEVSWTQEEPKNMGAWSYIAPKLQGLFPDKLRVEYNGRPEMSSPSEGDPAVHKKEQQRIINNVLTLTAASKDKVKQ